MRISPISISMLPKMGTVNKVTRSNLPFRGVLEDKFVSSSDDKSAVFDRQAKRFESMGRYDNAISCLEQSIELKNLALKEELLGLRDRDKINALKIAAGRTCINAGDVSRKADDANNPWGLDVSDKFYSMALEFLPESHEAHFKLALVRSKSGERGAEFHARRAIEINGNIPEYWELLANILYSRGEKKDIDEANRAIRKANVLRNPTPETDAGLY